MKSSELRVGNIISFNNFIQPQREVIITPRWFICSQQNEDFEINNYYQPILLNEEWLLRMGFEKNDNKSFSDSFYWIMVGSSKFNINPDNGVVWITREENIFNNPYLITSVHQLQNIYYALTGEELIIKLLESTEEDE